jgi:hypothetical protein
VQPRHWRFNAFIHALFPAIVQDGRDGMPVIQLNPNPGGGRKTQECRPLNRSDGGTLADTRGELTGQLVGRAEHPASSPAVSRNAGKSPTPIILESGRTQIAGEIGQAAHGTGRRIGIVRGSMGRRGAAVTMCNIYCLGWGVLVEWYADALISPLPGLFE